MIENSCPENVTWIETARHKKTISFRIIQIEAKNKAFLSGQKTE
jgi:hypothetical protein